MRVDLGTTRNGNPRRQRAHQLSVGMDPETLAEIDAAAKAAGVSRSDWVRERLEWALMDEKD